MTWHRSGVCRVLMEVRLLSNPPLRVAMLGDGEFLLWDLV